MDHGALQYDVGTNNLFDLGLIFEDSDKTETCLIQSDEIVTCNTRNSRTDNTFLKWLYNTISD